MPSPGFLKRVVLPYRKVSAASAASTLNDDIVAFWKLEEASGTRVDEVGSNDLTDNNTVTQRTGKIGEAASFNDFNDEYLSAVISALDSANRAIYGWVWFDDVNAINIAALSFGSSTTAEFIAISSENGNIKISSNGKTPGNGSSITTGEWHLLGLEWDGTQLHAFMDNSLDYSVTPSSAITWSELDMVSIGSKIASGAPAWPLDGGVDAVTWWSKTLTDEERTELWNSGAGKEYPF